MKTGRTKAASSRSRGAMRTRAATAQEGTARKRSGSGELHGQPAVKSRGILNGSSQSSARPAPSSPRRQVRFIDSDSDSEVAALPSSSSGGRRLQGRTRSTTASASDLAKDVPRPSAVFSRGAITLTGVGTRGVRPRCGDSGLAASAHNESSGDSDSSEFVVVRAHRPQIPFGHSLRDPQNAGGRSAARTSTAPPSPVLMSEDEDSDENGALRGMWGLVRRQTAQGLPILGRMVDSDEDDGNRSDAAPGSPDASAAIANSPPHSGNSSFGEEDRVDTTGDLNRGFVESRVRGGTRQRYFSFQSSPEWAPDEPFVDHSRSPSPAVEPAAARDPTAGGIMSLSVRLTPSTLGPLVLDSSVQVSARTHTLRASFSPVAGSRSAIGGTTLVQSSAEAAPSQRVYRTVSVLSPSSNGGGRPLGVRVGVSRRVSGAFNRREPTPDVDRSRSSSPDVLITSTSFRTRPSPLPDARRSPFSFARTRVEPSTPRRANTSPSIRPLRSPVLCLGVSHGHPASPLRVLSRNTTLQSRRPGSPYPADFDSQLSQMSPRTRAAVQLAMSESATRRAREGNEVRIVVPLNRPTSVRMQMSTWQRPFAAHRSTVLVSSSDSDSSDAEVLEITQNAIAARRRQEAEDFRLALQIAAEMDADSDGNGREETGPRARNAVRLTASALRSQRPLAPGQRCVICLEEQPAEPVGCLSCRQLLGCRTCIQKWRRTTNVSELNRHSPLSMGVSTVNHRRCPLCRAEWHDQPEIGLWDELRSD